MTVPSGEGVQMPRQDAKAAWVFALVAHEFRCGVNRGHEGIEFVRADVVLEIPSVVERLEMSGR